jgi:hypothetical protein
MVWRRVSLISNLEQSPIPADNRIDLLVFRINGG